jgi:hypothetical protein
MAMRWWLEFLPALLLAVPALAQASEVEALVLAKAYHETHNRHAMASTMDFYAPDASFQLNMGRPLVKGRSAIAELERFDAVAGSILLPYGWRAERQDDGWSVHVTGVIEHSRVFSAMGLDIVMAVPEAPVLILREGRIIHVNQPPLKTECTSQILSGLTALAGWLQAEGRPLASLLVVDGRLVLKPELLPAVLGEAAAWRAATGWHPDPSQVRACAEPVALAPGQR